MRQTDTSLSPALLSKLLRPLQLAVKLRTHAMINSAMLQVYNTGPDNDNALSISAHFSQIKMIFWFNEIKPERTAADNVVDWSFSRDPEIRDPFVKFVNGQRASTGAPYWVGLHSAKLFLQSARNIPGTVADKELSADPCMAGEEFPTFHAFYKRE